eukprot:gnl/Chilomastix_cuspidata/246.p1 GENE.gnl/Chilomastix_cuspidata/246~~gnl/Chilomastix_cuspidata/246.p1  ORF type:complete len:5604 (-),score=918.34 gnl/Chilomastix_cuspidata/246:3319-19830(-)
MIVELYNDFLRDLLPFSMYGFVALPSQTVAHICTNARSNLSTNPQHTRIPQKALPETHEGKVKWAFSSKIIRNEISGIIFRVLFSQMLIGIRSHLNLVISKAVCRYFKETKLLMLLSLEGKSIWFNIEIVPGHPHFLMSPSIDAIVAAIIKSIIQIRETLHVQLLDFPVRSGISLSRTYTYNIFEINPSFNFYFIDNYGFMNHILVNKRKEKITKTMISINSELDTFVKDLSHTLEKTAGHIQKKLLGNFSNSKTRRQKLASTANSEHHLESPESSIYVIQELLIKLENMKKASNEIFDYPSVVFEAPFRVSFLTVFGMISTSLTLMVSKTSDLLSFAIRQLIENQMLVMRKLIRSLNSVVISDISDGSNDFESLKALNPKFISRLNTKIVQAEHNCEMLLRIRESAEYGLSVFVQKSSITNESEKPIVFETEKSYELLSRTIEKTSSTLMEVIDKSKRISHSDLAEIDDIITEIRTTINEKQAKLNYALPRFKAAFTGVYNEILKDIHYFQESLYETGPTNHLANDLDSLEKEILSKGEENINVSSQIVGKSEYRLKLISSLEQASEKALRFRKSLKNLQGRCMFVVKAGNTAGVSTEKAITDLKASRTSIKFVSRLVNLFSTFVSLFTKFSELSWENFYDLIKQVSEEDETRAFGNFIEFLDDSLADFVSKEPKFHHQETSKVFQFLEKMYKYFNNAFIPSLKNIAEYDIHINHWNNISRMCSNSVLPPHSQAVIGDFISINFHHHFDQINELYTMARFKLIIAKTTTKILTKFTRVSLKILPIPSDLLHSWILEKTLPPNSKIPLILHGNVHAFIHEIRLSARQLHSQLQAIQLAGSEVSKNIEKDIIKKNNRKLSESVQILTEIYDFQANIITAFRLLTANRVDYQARIALFSSTTAGDVSIISSEMTGNPKYLTLPISRKTNVWENQLREKIDVNKFFNIPTDWEFSDLMKTNSPFSYCYPSELDYKTLNIKDNGFQIGVEKPFYNHTVISKDERKTLIKMIPEGIWFPYDAASALLSSWSVLMEQLQYQNSFNDFIQTISSIKSKFKRCTRAYQVFLDKIEGSYLLMHRRFNPYFSQLKNKDIISLISLPEIPTVVKPLQWSEANHKETKGGYISGCNVFEGTFSGGEILEAISESDTSDSSTSKKLSKYQKQRKDLLVFGTKMLQTMVPGVFSLCVSPDKRYITGVVLASDTSFTVFDEQTSQPRVLMFTRPITVYLPTTFGEFAAAPISMAIWLPLVVNELQASLKYCYFASLGYIGITFPNFSETKIRKNLNGHSGGPRRLQKNYYQERWERNLISTIPMDMSNWIKLIEELPTSVMMWMITFLSTIQISAAIIADSLHSEEMWSRNFSLLTQTQHACRELSSKYPTLLHITAYIDYLILAHSSIRKSRFALETLKKDFNAFKRSIRPHLIQSILSGKYPHHETFLFARYLTLSPSINFLSQATRVPQIFGYNIIKPTDQFNIPYKRTQEECAAMLDLGETYLPLVDLSYYSLVSLPPDLSKFLQHLKQCHRVKMGLTSRTSRLRSASFRFQIENMSSRVLSEQGNLESTRSQTKTSRDSARSQATSGTLESGRSTSMNLTSRSARSSRGKKVERIDFFQYITDTNPVFQKLTTFGWPFRSFTAGTCTFYSIHVGNSFITNCSFFVRIGNSPFFNSFAPLPPSDWWSVVSILKDEADIKSNQKRIFVTPNNFSIESIVSLQQITQTGFATIPYVRTPFLIANQYSTSHIARIFASVLGRFFFTFSLALKEETIKKISDIYSRKQYLETVDIIALENYYRSFLLPIHHQLVFYESIPSVAILDYLSLNCDQIYSFGKNINIFLSSLSRPYDSSVCTLLNINIRNSSKQYCPHPLCREFMPMFYNNEVISSDNQFSNFLSPVNPENIELLSSTKFDEIGGFLSPLYEIFSPLQETSPAPAPNVEKNGVFDHRGLLFKTKNLQDQSNLHEALGFKNSEHASLLKPPNNSCIPANTDALDNAFLTSEIYGILRSYPKLPLSEDQPESVILPAVSKKLASILVNTGLRYSNKQLPRGFLKHEIDKIIQVFISTFLHWSKLFKGNVMPAQILHNLFLYFFSFSVKTPIPLFSRLQQRIGTAIIPSKNVSAEGGLNYSGFYATSDSLSFIESDDERIFRIIASELTEFPDATCGDSTSQISRLKPTNLVNNGFVSCASPSLGLSTDIFGLFSSGGTLNYTLFHPALAQVICAASTIPNENLLKAKNKAPLNKLHAETAKEVEGLLGISPMDYSLFDVLVRKAFAETKQISKNASGMAIAMHVFKEIAHPDSEGSFGKIGIFFGLASMFPFFANSGYTYMVRLVQKLIIRFFYSHINTLVVNSSSDLSVILLSYAIALGLAGTQPFSDSLKSFHTKGFSALIIPTPYCILPGKAFKKLSLACFCPEIQKCQTHETPIVFEFSQFDHSPLFEQFQNIFKFDIGLSVVFRSKAVNSDPGNLFGDTTRIETYSPFDTITTNFFSEKYPTCFPFPRYWKETAESTNNIWKEIVIPALYVTFYDTKLWADPSERVMINPASSSFRKTISLVIVGRIMFYILSFEELFARVLVLESNYLPVHFVGINVVGDPRNKKEIIYQIFVAVFRTLKVCFKIPISICNRLRNFFLKLFDSPALDDIFLPFQKRYEETQAILHRYSLETTTDVCEHELLQDGCSQEKSDEIKKTLTNALSENYFSFINNIYHDIFEAQFLLPSFTDGLVFSSTIIRIGEMMFPEIVRTFLMISLFSNEKIFSLSQKVMFSFESVYIPQHNSKEEFIQQTLNRLNTLLENGIEDILHESKFSLVCDLTKVDIEKFPIVNTIQFALGLFMEKTHTSCSVFFLVSDNADNLSVKNSIFNECNESIADLSIPKEIDLHSFNQYNATSSSLFPSYEIEGMFGNCSIPFLKGSPDIVALLSCYQLLNSIEQKRMTQACIGLNSGYFEQIENMDSLTNTQIMTEFMRNFFFCLCHEFMRHFSNVRKDIVLSLLSSVLKNASLILDSVEKSPKELFLFPPPSELEKNGVVFSTGSVFLDAVIAGFGRAVSTTPSPRCGIYELGVNTNEMILLLLKCLKVPTSSVKPLHMFEKSPLIMGVAFLNPDCELANTFINGVSTPPNLTLTNTKFVFPNQAKVILPLVQYLRGFRTQSNTMSAPIVIDQYSTKNALELAKSAVELAFGSSRQIFELEVHDFQLESKKNRDTINRLFKYISKARPIDGVHDNYFGWDEAPVVFFTLYQNEGIELNKGPVLDLLRSCLNYPFSQPAFAIDTSILNDLVVVHRSSVIDTKMPETNYINDVSMFINNRIIPVVIVKRPVSGIKLFKEPIDSILTRNDMTSLFVSYGLTSSDFNHYLTDFVKTMKTEVFDQLPQIIQPIMKFKESLKVFLYDDVCTHNYIDGLKKKYYEYNAWDFIELTRTMLFNFEQFLKMEESETSGLRGDLPLIASLSVENKEQLKLNYFGVDSFHTPPLTKGVIITEKSDYEGFFPPLKGQYIENSNMIATVLETSKNFFLKMFPIYIGQFSRCMKTMLFAETVPRIQPLIERLLEQSKQTIKRLKSESKKLFGEYVKMESKAKTEKTKIEALEERLKNKKIALKRISDSQRDLVSSKRVLDVAQTQDELLFRLESFDHDTLSKYDMIFRFLKSCLLLLNSRPIGPINTYVQDIDDYSVGAFYFEDTSVPAPSIEEVELTDFAEFAEFIRFNVTRLTPETLELLEPYISSILFSGIQEVEVEEEDDDEDSAHEIKLISDIIRWIKLTIDCLGIADSGLNVLQKADLKSQISQLHKQILDFKEKLGSSSEEALVVEKQHKQLNKEHAEVVRTIQHFEKTKVVINSVLSIKDTIITPSVYRKNIAETAFYCLEYSLIFALFNANPEKVLQHEQKLIASVIKPVDFGQPPPGTIASHSEYHDQKYENVFSIISNPLELFYPFLSMTRIEATGIMTSEEKKIFSSAFFNPRTSVFFDPFDFVAPIVMRYFPTTIFFSSVAEFIQAVVGSFSLDEIDKTNFEAYGVIYIVVATIPDLEGKSESGPAFLAIAEKIRRSWLDGNKLFVILRNEATNISVDNFSFFPIPENAVLISRHIAIEVNEQRTQENLKLADVIFDQAKSIRNQLNTLGSFVVNFGHGSSPMDMVRSSEFAFTVKKTFQYMKGITQLRKAFHENIVTFKNNKKLFLEYSRRYFLATRAMLTTREILLSLHTSNGLTTRSNSHHYSNNQRIMLDNYINTTIIKKLTEKAMATVQKRQGAAKPALSNHLFFRETSQISLLAGKEALWFGVGQLPTMYRYSACVLHMIKIVSDEQNTRLLGLLVLFLVKVFQKNVGENTEALYAAAASHAADGAQGALLFKEIHNILNKTGEAASAAPEMQGSGLSAETLKEQRTLLIKLSKDPFLIEMGILTNFETHESQWWAWANRFNPMLSPYPGRVAIANKGKTRLERMVLRTMQMESLLIVASMMMPHRITELFIKNISILTNGIVDVSKPGLVGIAREVKFDSMNTDSYYLSRLPSYLSLMSSAESILQIPETVAHPGLSSFLRNIEDLAPNTSNPIPFFRKIVVFNPVEEEKCNYDFLAELVQLPVFLIIYLSSCVLDFAKFFNIICTEKEPDFKSKRFMWWLPLAAPRKQSFLINKYSLDFSVITQNTNFRVAYIEPTPKLCQVCHAEITQRPVKLTEFNVLQRTPGDILSHLLNRKSIEAFTHRLSDSVQGIFLDNHVCFGKLFENTYSTAILGMEPKYSSKEIIDTYFLANSLFADSVLSLHLPRGRTGLNMFDPNMTQDSSFSQKVGFFQTLLLSLSAPESVRLDVMLSRTLTPFMFFKRESEKTLFSDLLLSETRKITNPLEAAPSMLEYPSSLLIADIVQRAKQLPSYLNPEFNARRPLMDSQVLFSQRSASLTMSAILLNVGIFSSALDQLHEIQYIRHDPVEAVFQRYFKQRAQTFSPKKDLARRSVRKKPIHMHERRPSESESSYISEATTEGSLKHQHDSPLIFPNALVLAYYQFAHVDKRSPPVCLTRTLFEASRNAFDFDNSSAQTIVPSSTGSVTFANLITPDVSKMISTIASMISESLPRRDVPVRADRFAGWYRTGAPSVFPLGIPSFAQSPHTSGAQHPAASRDKVFKALMLENALPKFILPIEQITRFEKAPAGPVFTRQTPPYILYPLMVYLSSTVAWMKDLFEDIACDLRRVSKGFSGILSTHSHMSARTFHLGLDLFMNSMPRVWYERFKADDVFLTSHVPSVYEFFFVLLPKKCDALQSLSKTITAILETPITSGAAPVSGRVADLPGVYELPTQSLSLQITGLFELFPFFQAMLPYKYFMRLSFREVFQRFTGAVELQDRFPKVIYTPVAGKPRFSFSGYASLPVSNIYIGLTPGHVAPFERIVAFVSSMSKRTRSLFTLQDEKRPDEQGASVAVLTRNCSLVAFPMVTVPFKTDKQHAHPPTGEEASHSEEHAYEKCFDIHDCRIGTLCISFAALADATGTEMDLHASQTSLDVCCDDQQFFGKTTVIPYKYFPQLF